MKAYFFGFYWFIAGSSFTVPFSLYFFDQIKPFAWQFLKPDLRKSNLSFVLVLRQELLGN
jgi:hypothetical protein